MSMDRDHRLAELRDELADDPDAWDRAEAHRVERDQDEPEDLDRHPGDRPTS